MMTDISRDGRVFGRGIAEAVIAALGEPGLPQTHVGAIAGRASRAIAMRAVMVATEIGSAAGEAWSDAATRGFHNRIGMERAGLNAGGNVHPFRLKPEGEAFDFAAASLPTAS